jgi:hypothetical protein
MNLSPRPGAYVQAATEYVDDKADDLVQRKSITEQRFERLLVQYRHAELLRLGQF